MLDPAGSRSLRHHRSPFAPPPLPGPSSPAPLFLLLSPREARAGREAALASKREGDGAGEGAQRSSVCLDPRCYWAGGDAGLGRPGSRIVSGPDRAPSSWARPRAPGTKSWAASSPRTRRPSAQMDLPERCASLQTGAAVPPLAAHSRVKPALGEAAAGRGWAGSGRRARSGRADRSPH